MSHLQTIHEIVQEMRDNDQEGHIKKSKYVDFDFREDINTIEAYKNSKHISGLTDDLGREKPFFNIVISAINIWYRATDIDRKNIRLIAEKDSDIMLSFLENIMLQRWMREDNFGQFLNEWGLTLAEYLEAVVKFVEKDGKLHAKVIPWTTILCDPLDFMGNPVVERLYFTPAQLRKQTAYNKDIVNELLEDRDTRETTEGTQKDLKDDYIELYEVHGEFSVATLKQAKGQKVLEGDEDKYVQQMHIISLNNTEDSSKGKGYTLFSGEEDDPYLLTSLKPNSEGTITLTGAVKSLFDAQWMVNDKEKQIKDQLDLLSKKFWQTSDGNFVGQNALVNMQNGDILLHAINQPLTELSSRPDITAMQSSKGEWQQQGMQVNGINEAMTQAPKSGTAWRQTQAVLQEAHSLFELYTENKGLALEKMLNRFVIPFHRKKLNNKNTISDILDDYQIKMIDTAFVPNEAIRRVNQVKKDTILSGEVFDPSIEGELITSQEQLLQKALNGLGQQRFIKPDQLDEKTWKEVFKDVENRLIVDITGESKDIQAQMATYSTALQFLMSLQGRPMTDQEKLLFNRLIESSGSISPMELSMANNAPQVAPQAPQQGAIPQLAPQPT